MAEAQNFFLAAKNFTSYAFKPQTETVQWGGVYDKATIDPRTTTTKVFYARGNRNAAAGTQGTLVYKAEDDATTTLTFTWEVPWGSGTTSLDVSTTGNIKLDKYSFKDDEVLRQIVTVVIRDDEAPA